MQYYFLLNPLNLKLVNLKGCCLLFMALGIFLLPIFALLVMLLNHHLKLREYILVYLGILLIDHVGIAIFYLLQLTHHT